MLWDLIGIRFNWSFRFLETWVESYIGEVAIKFKKI